MVAGATCIPSADHQASNRPIFWPVAGRDRAATFRRWRARVARCHYEMPPGSRALAAYRRGRPMTIIVAVGCPEGVAVASDSRETYPVPGGLGVHSDDSQKLFLVGEADSATRDCACVVAWTGRAAFLGQEIEEHVQQFALSPRRSPLRTPRAVAEALFEYFEPRVLEDMQGRGVIGRNGAPEVTFLVAGCDADQPQVLHVAVPAGAVREHVPNSMAWLGCSRPLSKALLGRVTSAKDLVARPKRGLRTAHLTLDGAVELATFGVELTIGVERFTCNTPGLPTTQACGGPVRLATVQRRGGVSWVSRGEMFLSARAFLPPHRQTPPNRRRRPEMIPLPGDWDAYKRRPDAQISWR